ncbi:(R)-specific enoyl-CoA hydratase [Nymphon striatum]|nr:(R)-specific enoyl-CoA hydratase [Nymphon striatum]
MSDSSQPLFQEISKLRWHCRRGVKELDIVLSNYLDQHYEMANDNEKQAFKELLDFEDPILFAITPEESLESEQQGLKVCLTTSHPPVSRRTLNLAPFRAKIISTIRQLLICVEGITSPISMSKVLKIGDIKTIKREFTEDDVKQYAELSTDKNPVHLDAEYAANTQFKERIVHGMLVGSLFSALLGQHLPGEGSIYMSQNIQFKAPVFLDMEVTASVEITKIHPKRPIITLKTLCVDSEGKTLVKGEAVMYVPWYEVVS